MRTMTGWTAALILLPWLPRDSTGQTAGTMRVRVERSILAQGRLAGRFRDTLFLESGGKAVGYATQPDYVIERYQPKPATGVGAVLGALAGTVAGVVIARGQHATCDLSDPWCAEGMGALGVALIGTTVGLGVGGFLGSHFKRMGWSRIDLVDIPEEPRIAAIAHGGRYGLVLELRW